MTSMCPDNHTKMSIQQEGASPHVPEILKIGHITISSRGFLAPMSGVTDMPFRRLAHELGAGLVVSEMVASEALVRGNSEEMRLKARQSEDIRPRIVQLAGREDKWMGEAAKLCADLGADIIDINMGCPAKKVTNGFSGSALMRDPDHALGLIKSVVQAVSLPVTVKMRLGWDHATLNAGDIAKRAEELGVQMISVHGRTRCQFYNGVADWDAIADVGSHISVPLVANGDLTHASQASEMINRTKANAVMVGRGAYGKPWLPGQVSAVLAGRSYVTPSVQEQGEIVLRHYEGMLFHYGAQLGMRCARKHLGWYLDTAYENFPNISNLSEWKYKIMRETSVSRVKSYLREFYDHATERCVA